jgi:hypothetical protein
MLRLFMTSLLSSLLAISMLFAACGGDDDDDDDDDSADDATATEAANDDDEPTAEETGDDTADDDDAGSSADDPYWQELEALSQDFRADGQEIDSQYGEDRAAATSEDEVHELTVQYLADGGALLETFVLDLSDLEPPPVAEAAHENAISVLTDTLVFFSGVFEEAPDLTVAEIEAAFGTEEAMTLDAAGDQSCFALQDIADSEGAGIDMQCPA